jgi:ferredoxin--NADP+ reductase
VIGTNKKCASGTVSRIVEDRDAGRLPRPASIDRTEVEAWLRTRVANLVTWDGWTAIDAHETAAGEPHGRPRVKLVRVPDMHAIAG